jgi:hypothetical protein
LKIRLPALFQTGRRGLEESMSQRKFSDRDHPMRSEDLAVCQQVLEAVKAEFHLEDDDEEVSRSAAITIELYRQGVRDFEQLKILVFAARGKI